MACAWHVLIAIHKAPTAIMCCVYSLLNTVVMCCANAVVACHKVDGRCQRIYILLHRLHCLYRHCNSTTKHCNHPQRFAKTLNTLVFPFFPHSPYSALHYFSRRYCHKPLQQPHSAPITAPQHVVPDPPYPPHNIATTLHHDEAPPHECPT